MYLRIVFCVVACGILLGCVSSPTYRPPAYSEDVQPPTLVEDSEPIYPKEAREKGLQGTVDMYLLVTDKGQVKKARIVKSSGYDILDSAATRYANRLQFDPARRESSPTSIWITWAVDYDLVSTVPSFVPSEYVRKIKDLYRRADQATGNERYELMEEILKGHDEYVQHTTRYPDINYNRYIRQFVKPEVHEQWRDFWQDWPLVFVVFHDFALRYPDSDHVAHAISRMVELIKNDIHRIKVGAEYNEDAWRKKDLFLKKIYTFLDDEYPHALTDDLRIEAEKYLEK